MSVAHRRGPVGQVEAGHVPELVHDEEVAAVDERARDPAGTAPRPATASAGVPSASANAAHLAVVAVRSRRRPTTIPSAMTGEPAITADGLLPADRAGRAVDEPQLGRRDSSPCQTVATVPDAWSTAGRPRSRPGEPDRPPARPGAAVEPDEPAFVGRDHRDLRRAVRTDQRDRARRLGGVRLPADLPGRPIERDEPGASVLSSTCRRAPRRGRRRRRPASATARAPSAQRRPS